MIWGTGYPKIIKNADAHIYLQSKSKKVLEITFVQHNQPLYEPPELPERPKAPGAHQQQSPYPWCSRTQIHSYTSSPEYNINHNSRKFHAQSIGIFLNTVHFLPRQPTWKVKEQSLRPGRQREFFKVSPNIDRPPQHAPMAINLLVVGYGDININNLTLLYILALHWKKKHMSSILLVLSHCFQLSPDKRGLF